MTGIPSEGRLVQIVDDLWRNPHKRDELAKDAGGRLGEVDWLVIAGWAVAANFGPLGGKLIFENSNIIKVLDHWDKLIIQAVLEDSEEDLSKEQQVVCFVGYGKRARVMEGYVGATKRINVRVGSLLVGLQLIRDHLDSCLIKPKPFRDQELAQFARISGLDEDFFGRLSIWCPAINHHLETKLRGAEC